MPPPRSTISFASVLQLPSIPHTAQTGQQALTHRSIPQPPTERRGRWATKSPVLVKYKWACEFSSRSIKNPSFTNSLNQSNILCVQSIALLCPSVVVLLSKQVSPCRPTAASKQASLLLRSRRRRNTNTSLPTCACCEVCHTARHRKTHHLSDPRPFSSNPRSPIHHHTGGAPPRAFIGRRLRRSRLSSECTAAPTTRPLATYGSTTTTTATTILQSQSRPAPAAPPPPPSALARGPRSDGRLRLPPPNNSGSVGPRCRPGRGRQP